MLHNNMDTPVSDLTTNVVGQLTVLKAATNIAHLLSKASTLEPTTEPLITEFIALTHAECGSI
ncbi:hypothetical protein L0128_13185 [candidate division KSB1 bacterium]|nr:hypothetical protein [candidate division KSB1 bacterium]